MVFYDTLITLLNNLGFFNVILPFLLVYAIMYGILSKYKILGDPFAEGDRGKTTRSLISIVSAATGFFIVASSNVVLSLKTLNSIYSIILINSIFPYIGNFSIFTERRKEWRNTNR